MGSANTYYPEDRGYESLCWIWSGKPAPVGYGQVNRDGKGMGYAHRYMYEKHCGPIPEGLQVHHKCHVKMCVNPEHLELLPRSEHASMHCSFRGGETHPSASLTDSQVQEIRRLYYEGGITQVKLAAMYGISGGHVSRIVTGVRRKASLNFGRS